MWKALSPNAPLRGPGSSNESGVHIYNSEVYCIVDSFHLFALIDVTKCLSICVRR